MDFEASLHTVGIYLQVYDYLYVVFYAYAIQSHIARALSL